jgi:hypothetical protein
MLLELARELAPAVIADLFAINARTAVRGVRAAAGDWKRLRRPTRFFGLCRVRQALPLLASDSRPTSHELMPAPTPGAMAAYLGPVR